MKRQDSQQLAKHCKALTSALAHLLHLLPLQQTFCTGNKQTQSLPCSQRDAARSMRRHLVMEDKKEEEEGQAAHDTRCTTHLMTCCGFSWPSTDTSCQSKQMQRCVAAELTDVPCIPVS